jgi:hypothetical protein
MFGHQFWAVLFAIWLVWIDIGILWHRLSIRLWYLLRIKFVSKRVNKLKTLDHKL